MQLDVKAAQIKFTTIGLTPDAASARSMTSVRAESIPAANSSDTERQQIPHEPVESEKIVKRDCVGVVCFKEGDAHYVYIPEVDYDAVVKDKNALHLATWWKFDAYASKASLPGTSFVCSALWTKTRRSSQ